MKLASLDDGSLDGTLILVHSDGNAYVDGYEGAAHAVRPDR
jgi:hypothetical protein